MKMFLQGLALFLMLSFAGIAVKVIFFPMNTFEKSVDTAYQVTDKVLDGDKAIYDYEWFKRQEAAIRTNLQNEVIAQEEYDAYVAGLPADRTTWGDFEKQEEASLRNSASALEKLTNRSMEDYNAKSEMVSRNIFKDNLPSNVTRAFYAGKQLLQ